MNIDIDIGKKEKQKGTSVKIGVNLDKELGKIARSLRRSKNEIFNAGLKWFVKAYAESKAEEANEADKNL